MKHSETFTKIVHVTRAALKPKWHIFFVLLALSQLPWILRPSKVDILKPEQTEQQFGIADLIDKVRTDLRVSHERMLQEKQGAMFVVKSFDLEVNFVVRKSAKVEGKFEADVVTVNGARELAGERTQKIMLHMEQYVEPIEIPPNRNVPLGNSEPATTKKRRKTGSKL